MNDKATRLDQSTLSTEQREAYLELKSLLKLDIDLPYTKDWSASPDFLLLIASYCLENRPQLILECSSGTSSYVLARCCQLNGSGKVMSLEHEKVYAEQSQQSLIDAQLDGFCEVIHAPLTSYIINNIEYQWYALDKLDTQTVDMLIIDGPPGFMQKNARYPAMPLLHNRLAEQCIVYMDDAARSDEQEIIHQWCSEWPYSVTTLSKLELTQLPLERGCAQLKLY